MLKWDCSQDHLEPVFRQDVIDLLTPSEYDWRIVYGFRSLDLQEKLYQAHLAGGPLAAPPGKSAHNYGLAVDVQLWIDGPHGKMMDWNVKHPGWQWLFHAIAPTPHLHSGMSFGDYDHIERFNWKAFRDWDSPKKPVTATA